MLWNQEGIEEEIAIIKMRVTPLVPTDTDLIPNTSVVFLTPNADTIKKCMFCTLDIKKPVGCPIKTVEIHNNLKYNDKEHAHEYVTYGLFCSYNCALAYALDRQSNVQFSNSPKYIALISRRENNGKPVDVIPSPPKELMMMYGGYMTEQQYSMEKGKILYTSNGTTITHPTSLVYNRG